MNVSPPIPWRDVPVGAVVLIDDTPRTVLANQDYEAHGWRLILAEGMGPFSVRPDDTASLVLLDTADAVANLRGAGLTTEVINP